MTIVGATTRITSGFITTVLASYLFFFSGVHEPLAQEHLHYHNPSDAFASISIPSSSHSSPSSSSNSYPSRLVPIDIWEEAGPSYTTHHRHHQDEDQDQEQYSSYHREKVYQRTEGPERILVNDKHEHDREREYELLQLKREEERIKEDLYRLRQERERQLRLKQQEEEEWEKEFQRRRRSSVRGNVYESDDQHQHQHYMKGSPVMEPRMNPSPDVLEMDQRLNVHRSDLPWNELFLSATLGFLIILSYFLAKLHEKATTEWSNSSSSSPSSNDEDDTTNIIDEEDIQRMEKSLFNQDNKVHRKKMSYGRSSALDTQQNFATTPTKNNDNNNRYGSYRWSPSSNQSSAFVEVKESGIKPIIVKNVTPSSSSSSSSNINNSSIKQNEEQQKEVSRFENDGGQPLEVKEPLMKEEMIEETEKEIHRHEDDLEESIDSFESPKTESLNNNNNNNKNKKSSGKMDGSFIFIDKTSPRQRNTA